MTGISPGRRRLPRAGATLLALTAVGLGLLTGPLAGTAGAVTPAGSVGSVDAAGSVGGGRSGGAAGSKPDPSGMPVTVTLTGINPIAFSQKTSLVVTGTVRNTGRTTLTKVRVNLRLDWRPITDRRELAAWVALAPNDLREGTLGSRLNTVQLPAPLPPGGVVGFTVTGRGDAVELPTTAAGFGPRRMNVEVAGVVGGQVRRVGIVRTFAIWSPVQEYAPTRMAMLVPLTSGAEPVTGTGVDTSLAEQWRPTGRLTRVLTATASNPGEFSYAIDPSLLMAAEGTQRHADQHQTPTPSASTGPSRPGASRTATSGGVSPSVAVSSAGSTAGRRAAATITSDATSWLAQLTDARQGRDVLALPYGDPDVTALAGDRDGDVLDLAAKETSTVTAASFGEALPGNLVWPASGHADQATADLAAPDPTSRRPARWLVMSGSAAAVAQPGGAVPARGRLVTSGGDAGVLLWDDALSGALAGVGGTDSVLATQRLLAETAAITATNPGQPQVVLAVTPRTWNPDPTAVQASVTALRNAPWLQLEQWRKVRDQQPVTVSRSKLPRATAPVSGSGQLPEKHVSDVARLIREMQAFVPTMDEHAQQLVIDPGRRAALEALSVSWSRHSPRDLEQQRSSTLYTPVNDLYHGVSVVPGTANMIADTGQLPVIIANRMEVPITVYLYLSPTSGRVQVGRPIRVDLAAGRSTTVRVKLRAISNGEAQIRTSLRAPGADSSPGPELVQGQTITIKVHLDWQNLGLLWVGLLLAVLLLIGLIRGVRRGRVRISPENVPDPDDVGRDSSDGTPPRDGSPDPRDDLHHGRDGMHHEQDDMRYDQDGTPHDQDDMRYDQDGTPHDQNGRPYEQDEQDSRPYVARHRGDADLSGAAREPAGPAADGRGDPSGPADHALRLGSLAVAARTLRGADGTVGPPWRAELSRIGRDLDETAEIRLEPAERPGPRPSSLDPRPGAGHDPAVTGGPGGWTGEGGGSGFTGGSGFEATGDGSGFEAAGDGSGFEAAGDGATTGSGPEGSGPSDELAEQSGTAGRATSRLLSSSAIMAAGSLVSRVLGLVRTITLGWAIGVVGAGADSFAVANSLPNSLSLLIGAGVLNAVLVPQIVRAAKHPDGGQEYIDRLVTLAILVLGGATLLATALAPVLVRLYSQGWSAERISLTTAFAFWCLPQIFFYGIYTIYGQILNARNSFGPYMWASSLYNVGCIVGCVAFVLMFGAGDKTASWWGFGSVALLGGTATVGVVAQALVLLPALRRVGYRWRFRWGWRGIGLRTAGTVAAWTFGLALVGQLGFIPISRAATLGGTASGAAAGRAVYDNAYLLFFLPHGLVAVSLVTAVFTRMAASAAQGLVDQVREDVSLAVRLTGVATVISTVAFVVLGRDMSRSLFLGNSLSETDSIALATGAMVLGLVPFSANYLFQRVFYAYEDARTPFGVQLVVVTVWVSGSVLSAAVLPGRWVVPGIGAAMSLSSLVGASLSVFLLRRRIGYLDGARVVRTHVRLVVAALVAGVVAWFVDAGVHGALGVGRGAALVALALGASALLLAYGVLLKVMKVEEFAMVVTPLTARLRRRAG